MFDLTPEQVSNMDGYLNKLREKLMVDGRENGIPDLAAITKDEVIAATGFATITMGYLKRRKPVKLDTLLEALYVTVRKTQDLLNKDQVAKAEATALYILDMRGWVKYDKKTEMIYLTNEGAGQAIKMGMHSAKDQA